MMYFYSWLSGATEEQVKGAPHSNSSRKSLAGVHNEKILLYAGDQAEKRVYVGMCFYVDPLVSGLYFLFLIQCIQLQNGALPSSQLLSGIVCPEKGELTGFHGCSSIA